MCSRRSARRPGRPPRWAAIAFEHAFGNTGSDREAILAANKFAARNPLKTKVTQSDYTCLRIANRLAARDELTDLLDGAVVISDE